jgi:hypothetical protein
MESIAFIESAKPQAGVLIATAITLKIRDVELAGAITASATPDPVDSFFPLQYLAQVKRTGRILI